MDTFVFDALLTLKGCYFFFSNSPGLFTMMDQMLGIKQASITLKRLKLYITPFSAAAAAKSLQSCPTLCDPRDDSPPGFPVSGILQARTLEWVAIF